jgi:hypothetical protein
MHAKEKKNVVNQNHLLVPHPPPARSKATRRLPDETLHHPPGAMLTIGWIGVIAGVGANLWQMLTTVSAFLLLFRGGRSSQIDVADVTFWISALIAFSFQFALMMLVFRIDSTWKKHQVKGPGSKQQRQGALRATAVEVVQQVNLVLIWAALAFVVDTIGDFTFIGERTSHLEAATAIFLMFSYAIALYALSTIAFVRSIEYLWAGYATLDLLKVERERRLSRPQPKY